MGYANEVMTPNSNFSFGSYPGTLRKVRPCNSFCSTYDDCQLRDCCLEDFRTSRLESVVFNLVHQFTRRLAR